MTKTTQTTTSTGTHSDSWRKKTILEIELKFMGKFRREEFDITPGYFDVTTFYANIKSGTIPAQALANILKELPCESVLPVPGGLIITIHIE